MWSGRGCALSSEEANSTDGFLLRGWNIATLPVWLEQLNDVMCTSVLVWGVDADRAAG